MLVDASMGPNSNNVSSFGNFDFARSLGLGYDLIRSGLYLGQPN